jgi:hypothetical protein
MRRFLFVITAVTILAAGASCTPEGVGDPCEPESCPPKLDDLGNPIPGECGWEASEVYLEHFSLQCRTRVCMVFRAEEGLWEPYCTRRCGPGAAIKGCGEKYTCMEVVTGTTPGAGCYCVNEEQINLLPGSADMDKVNACK